MILQLSPRKNEVAARRTRRSGFKAVSVFFVFFFPPFVWGLFGGMGEF